MESPNQGVIDQDRLLWGMSPAQARLVLIVCLAALVYVVRGEIVDSPKARVRMDSLRSELASLMATTGPGMHGKATYGPGKAMATCGTNVTATSGTLNS